MISVPYEIQDLYTKDSIRKNFRVILSNGTHLVNKDILSESVIFTESISSSNPIKFGLMEGSSLQFQTFYDSNIKGTKIAAYIEIDISSLDQNFQATYGSTKSDVPYVFYRIYYGDFIVDSCKRDIQTGIRTIVAYQTKGNKISASLIPFSNNERGKLDTFKHYSPNGNSELYDASTGEITLEMQRQEPPFETCDKFDVDFLHVLAESMGSFELLNSLGITPVETTLSTYDSTYLDYMGSSHYTSIDPSASYTSSDIDEYYYGYCIGTFGKHLYYDKDSNDVPRSRSYVITNGSIDYNALYLIKWRVPRTTPPGDYSVPTVIIDNSERSATDPCNVFPGFGEILTYKIKDYYYDYEEDCYCAWYYPKLLPLHNSTYRQRESNNVSEYYAETMQGNIRFCITTKHIVVESHEEIILDSSQSSTIVEDITTESYYVGNPFVSITKYTFDDTVSMSFLMKYTNNTYKQTFQGDKYIYYDEYSAKDVLTNFDFMDYVKGYAELNGMFIGLTRDLTLQFRKLVSTSALYPVNSLYPSNSLYPQEQSHIITGSICKQAWWDDDYAKPYAFVICKFKAIDETAENETYKAIQSSANAYNRSDFQNYDLSTNPFIASKTCTRAQIDTWVNNLANILKNLNYYACNIEIRGLPYMEAGDELLIVGTNETIKTFSLRHRISGVQGLMDTIEAQ